MKFVPKKWGSEQWICNTPEYCGKKLTLLRDHHCSLHYHLNKKEHFFLESGSVLLITSDQDCFKSNPAINLQLWFGEHQEFWLKQMERTGLTYQVFMMRPGDCQEILPETRHLFYGISDSILFEFSTHHEDSDSYRLTESY